MFEITISMRIIVNGRGEVKTKLNRVIESSSGVIPMKLGTKIVAEQAKVSMQFVRDDMNRIEDIICVVVYHSNKPWENTEANNRLLKAKADEAAKDFFGHGFNEKQGITYEILDLKLTSSLELRDAYINVSTVEADVQADYFGTISSTETLYIRKMHPPQDTSAAEHNQTINKENIELLEDKIQRLAIKFDALAKNTRNNSLRYLMASMVMRVDNTKKLFSKYKDFFTNLIYIDRVEKRAMDKNLIKKDQKKEEESLQYYQCVFILESYKALFSIHEDFTNNRIAEDDLEKKWLHRFMSDGCFQKNINGRLEISLEFRRNDFRESVHLTLLDIIATSIRRHMLIRDIIEDESDMELKLDGNKLTLLINEPKGRNHKYLLQKLKRIILECVPNFAFSSTPPQLKSLEDEAKLYCETHNVHHTFYDAIKQGNFNLALRRACAAGDIELVEMLERYDADYGLKLNYQEASSNGKNAIDWAISSGNTVFVNYVKACDAACRDRVHVWTVDELRSPSTVSNDSPIRIREQYHIELLKRVLGLMDKTEIVYADVLKMIRKREYHGAIWLLCSKKHQLGNDILDVLLAYKDKLNISVNLQDGDKHFTPLHLSACEGNLGAYRVLMKHGADGSMRDREGKVASEHLQGVDLARFFSLA